MPGRPGEFAGPGSRPNLFPLLGIEPRHERSFSAAEAAEKRRSASWPEGFRLASLDADVFEPHTLFPDWEGRRCRSPKRVPQWTAGRDANDFP